GLKVPPATGRKAAKFLPSALQRHFCPYVIWRQVEGCHQRDVPACDTTLPPILCAARALGLGQFHFYVGCALDVGDPNIHLHREVRGILYGHSLEVWKQRAEFLRVGEEGIDLVRLARHFKVAAELNRHATRSSCVPQRSRWL